MVGAERRRPRNRFGHDVTGRATVDFEDLGPFLDAGGSGGSIGHDEAGDDPAVIDLANGKPQTTIGLGGKEFPQALRRCEDVTVGNSVREISQGQLVRDRVVAGLGTDKPGAELVRHRVPVDGLVLRERVLGPEQLDHRVERFRVGQAREVVRSRLLTLDEIDQHLSRPIERERTRIHSRPCSPAERSRSDRRR